MRRLTFLGLLLVACSKTSPPEATADSGAGMASAVPADPRPAAPPDVAAAPADAQKTASGLASKVLTPGTGKDHPGRYDKVKVNYTGWTKAGRTFDSSVGGEPLQFRLNQVIKGWTEGLQLMVVGEKRRLWIPGELAYGTEPDQGDTPKGDLVFDVELLDFTPGPKAPEVPADVKAPPADAKKTASGLAYKVLKAGTGKKHPTPKDSVTAKYSGWKADGTMFDSWVEHGEPITFQLDHVIKGWTEGVQLMVVGETTRFWIPSDLAYGDVPKRKGAPSGPLVFDIELTDIK